MKILLKSMALEWMLSISCYLHLALCIVLPHMNKR